MTEINKYQTGKIYKIICNKTKLVYIGSTIQKYLCNRLKGHCHKYKMYLDKRHHFVSSFKILENNDYYIELVELFPCNSKDELLVRERYYYDNIECVNNNKPQMTEDEKKEYFKNYRIEHREERKIYKKEYDEINKDKHKIYGKKYHIENKEYKRERRSIKYTCECGSTPSIGQRKRHDRSIKHIKYLNQTNLL